MAAKGSVAKAERPKINDVNVKQMTMGNGWTTRAMRRQRNGGASTPSKGKK